MQNIIDYTMHQKNATKGGSNMCTILKKLRNKKPKDLFSEYGISANPPVDIASLLEAIGISTIAHDFSEVENILGKKPGSVLGAALTDGEILAIFYKQSDSLHRKKFTIAHELGHCCLHCPTNESNHIEYRIEPFRDIVDDSILKKEHEANIFAGELLIPEQSLRKYYSKFIVPSLADLSKIFDVSASVMAARLDYLQLPYFKDSATESFI